MKYYVSIAVASSGDGSQLHPFRTIGEAARVAVAGDEVIVAPGIYREYVNPSNGGTDDEHRIVYRSERPGGAVITGAERITGWQPYDGDTWVVRVSNAIFGDYNPYTVCVRGDWYTVEKDFPVHTGEVYLNDKAMYEAPRLDWVLKAAPSPYTWDREASARRWYTEQCGDETVIYANFGGLNPNEQNVEINVRRNCFYPSETGRGYITLSGFKVCKAATQWAPPTAYQEGMVGPHWSKGWIIEDCEISDSKCSGISLGKYLQPNNDNKWTTWLYKDGTQTERDAICQAQAEGWSKETIGSHIVRRCDIHDCGQTGIVGHLGGVFSIIEDNHIHHINNKQELTGAEIGGIKMHAAIDVIVRRNHIHHCTRGLWLDWQAQGTRVTRNCFHDNMPPAGITIRGGLAFGEDIFVEVSHGPTLIDHNLLLSTCAARVSTQGIAFAHNLIAGSFTYVGEGTNNGGRHFPTPRYTPYHMHHRTEVAGFMTILHGDARFYNNIFVQQPVRQDLAFYVCKAGLGRLNQMNLVCGTLPYTGYPTAEKYFGQFTPENATDYLGRDKFYDHLPVYTGGNVFFNCAEPCDTEQEFAVVSDREVSLRIQETDEGWTLRTNLYEALPELRTAVVDTARMGMAFEPEQLFENPDGTPICMDRDYFDRARGDQPLPGPFEAPVSEVCVARD
ncbi:MAG: right-handed parallel beta-helix repeat-containing protein [Clostridia bacterium]|nr:right-handed parallel beta-helix repeat-containing protein [Clostridia bacterium]